MHTCSRAKALLAAALAPGLILLAASAAIAQSTPTPQPAQTPQPAAPSKWVPENFRSAEDGWMDMSAFMASRYCFMPIGAPITEPAVGLGVAGGVAFTSAPDDTGRPNVTGIGGLGTENGTKGVFAADIRYYRDHQFQTIAKAIYASVI